jgi:FdhD protein
MATIRPTAEIDVLAVADAAVRRSDAVAVEEPLEIRIGGADPLVAMRTPGADEELVAGLLLSEGVVTRAEEIAAIEPVAGCANVVRVALDGVPAERLGLLARTSLSNSACGVCGKVKLSTDPLASRPTARPGPPVPADTLLALPDRLRAAQGVFAATGGLHAAGLFDAEGRLEALREDVGRHNALDKLFGAALRAGRLPLDNRIVLLSGRASYELLQKAVMAGVPVVCAISAPSSFAVQVARTHGVTLVGFLRQGRFNVYAHPERIAGLPAGANAPVTPAVTDGDRTAPAAR